MDKNNVENETAAGTEEEDSTEEHIQGLYSHQRIGHWQKKQNSEVKNAIK